MLLNLCIIYCTLKPKCCEAVDYDTSAAGSLKAKLKFVCFLIPGSLVLLIIEWSNILTAVQHKTKERHKESEVYKFI